MEILEVKESRERCAESGWFAYDYFFENPIDSKTILSLKDIGAMTYLPMLKKPFFKIESDYVFLKGMEGDNFIRIAVHDKHREALKRVEDYINNL